VVRRWILLIGLICGTASPCSGMGDELERGLAIIDPLALRELDLGEHQADGLPHPGFGLRRMLDPTGLAGPLRNDRLFALPTMVAVRQAIDQEFDRYLDRHRAAALPRSIGVGPSYDVQLFDRDRLYSGASRFVLAGIVNRIDRGYVASGGCGEIRLIYRLVADPDAGDAASPAQRLPMTLNLVLTARGDQLACAEIARRWLDVDRWQRSGAALALDLTSGDGPLASIKPDDIDRIETNLQIAHRPKSPTAEFRTDYLLKVFRRDPASGAFAPSPLENQIDRDRIAADHELGLEFRRWLLEPTHLGEFDRGTVLLPDKFLAGFAIAATPVGFESSRLQPAFGLVAPADPDPLFSETDVVAALQRAADNGIVLQNIRSLAGFERRLNDITCTGCHQTRGIGGFHLPGGDWTQPGAVAGAVPVSPHFVGDQVRRRDIVMALRDGKQPDYSRGFSDRPQLRGSAALLGTEYADGWGAHCDRGSADGGTPDPSFRSWTCADGLSCQAAVVGSPARIGMCFVENR